MDAQSRVACAQASGFQESKVGAPIRFSDSIGIDVRVVTGITPLHDNGTSMMVVCAFDRRTGKAEVVEAPAAAVVTALPSAPSIEGIVWRAEDIGGGGIIDRSRATLTFGADGRISGRASCNDYSASYALDRGALSLTSALAVTQRACVPSLMDQERRFLAILAAARQIELLPTGALLLSIPEGKTLRFFPDEPVRPVLEN
jgi:heat shock protein HslJ